MHTEHTIHSTQTQFTWVLNIATYKSNFFKRGIKCYQQTNMQIHTSF
uniref:Uncharacterized protein n=1 Tax=Arundo donax TaxID=35708 RepID=A0A0A8ZBE3_ARUDO